MQLSPVDQGFLQRATEVGRRGWGRVSPNPMVGCVVVREGRVVGEGWHQEFGGEHAELHALRMAGLEARGADVFVSLEPCRHFGKTPPCTDALLEAGVSRVVYGAADPGALEGGGGDVLRRAGVRVEGPLLSEREARWENPFFFHGENALPWLALKLALTLDGRIAAGEGRRTDLSGAEAQREVHRLRAGVDALLVGTETALVDDPLLTVRGDISPRKEPVRVLMDARGGRLEGGMRILREGSAPVWILTTPSSPEGWRQTMRSAGAELLDVPSTDEGRINLGRAMESLAERGIRSVLCEGGGRLGAALLRGGWLHRLYLVVVPDLLGAGGVPAFPELRFDGPQGEGRGSRWRLGEPARQLGRDLWMALEPEGEAACSPGS